MALNLIAGRALTLSLPRKLEPNFWRGRHGYFFWPPGLEIHLISRLLFMVSYKGITMLGFDHRHSYHEKRGTDVTGGVHDLAYCAWGAEVLLWFSIGGFTGVETKESFLPNWPFRSLWDSASDVRGKPTRRIRFSWILADESRTLRQEGSREKQDKVLSTMLNDRGLFQFKEFTLTSI